MGNPKKHPAENLIFGAVFGAILGIIPGGIGAIFFMPPTGSFNEIPQSVVYGLLASGGAGAGMLFSFVNYEIGYEDGQSDERVELLYQFREWETKNSDKIQRLQDALLKARTELEALKKLEALLQIAPLFLYRRL